MTDLVKRAVDGFNPTPLEIEMAEEIHRLREAAKGSAVIFNHTGAAIRERDSLLLMADNALSRLLNWPDTMTNGTRSEDIAVARDTLTEIRKHFALPEMKTQQGPQHG